MIQKTSLELIVPYEGKLPPMHCGNGMGIVPFSPRGQESDVMKYMWMDVCRPLVLATFLQAGYADSHSNNISFLDRDDIVSNDVFKSSVFQ